MRAINLNNFSSEIKLARVNLDIDCRLLITQSEFVKCNDCSAPITHGMIPEFRFSASFHPDLEWTCRKGHKNGSDHIFC